MNDNTKTQSMTHRILRLPLVIERTGLGRTMIYQLQASGDFPAKLKLGCRAVGWMESEIDAWVRSRASARLSKPATHRNDNTVAV